MKKDFINIADLTKEEIYEIFDVAPDDLRNDPSIEKECKKLWRNHQPTESEIKLLAKGTNLYNIKVKNWIRRSEVTADIKKFWKKVSGMYPIGTDGHGYFRQLIKKLEAQG